MIVLVKIRNSKENLAQVFLYLNKTEELFEKLKYQTNKDSNKRPDHSFHQNGLIYLQSQELVLSAGSHFNPI